MSLLNDALRAAEQRRERPEVPAVYPGQHGTVAGGEARWQWGALCAFVIVTLLLVLGLGGYWLLGQDSRGEEGIVPVAPAISEVEQIKLVEPAGQIAAPAPESTVVVAHSEAPAAKPEPEPKPEPASESTPELMPAPEPVAKTTESVAPEPVPAAKVQSSVATTGDGEPEASTRASVKQIRETPEAIDRRTSREIERLTASGQWTEAGRALAALTGRQTAPRSRGAMAKALLVNGEPGRALLWLPAEVTDTHPSLRLLRGRALLEQGNLEAAVATLDAQVPPVDGNAEYRVTLATLLQQQGRNQEAARHWAELIAWDDSRGPWWVGLGIALESQGERVSAARAYQQAVALPNLPRSLADYVRQRLQSLRAG